MSSRNLHKAENPSAYAKLAREGMMIGYPVKIRGESHRSDNNIPYHSTLKFFNTEKDHPHQIHHLARHLSLNAPDPKTTQIEPSQLKDHLGNDVYVLKLKGNSAEKMKEHNAKFSHMGDPQSYVYEPHISVPKSVHDKIKSSGAKTAHEAGIEFGPAELKHGSKTLKVYRHEPDSAEPKFPDYGDFTSKINKSEEILDESAALPEDEDAHALLNRQEDKYFLPKKYIEQVIIALSDRLALGDIDTDTRYNTNRTIYLDDKDLNTFHECMLKKKPRMKVRIRQYSPNSQGWEEVAYAEFKMKEEDGFTKKIRVRLPSKYVEILSNGGQITLDENLVNINKDIDRKALEARVKAINSIIFRRGLRRQLEVRYERRAYTGKNLRITIDENLRYMDATPISENVKKVLEEEKEWKEFSEPYILAAWENPFILEIKSDKEVPGWLKQLLREVNAKRASFSKYSAAILNQIKTDKNEGDVLGTVGYLDSAQELGKSEECLYSLDKMEKNANKTTFHHESELPKNTKIGKEHLPSGGVGEYGENHRLNTTDNHYFAVRNNKVIGHIGIKSDPDDYHKPVINASYINPEHRGKGIGIGLYHHVLSKEPNLASDNAREPGANAIWNKLKQAYPNNIAHDKKANRFVWNNKQIHKSISKSENIEYCTCEDC